ncbi:hypothetical protein COY88_00845 [Candidatus Roizmanbacteria bacterium CG_4_10_14_0_8_um_filter_35_28]|uniref:Sporulation stage II protein D amidase enhancer LytB N-terminal domain-containing protein n=4 Tax=Candidatus Roizmaniibacteriota TaxID=1752723 RepID=A0A2M8F0S9_9BACT|nr:MAG: hypothetical protein COX47_00490 [Candidatus Roizmanbacteria bacterium CG23_combo_of_CG06-09_8_20_14_all_35_49]PIY71343.1 MAG: hypothetical protein COY88_00845 [Candidatus Roizmanbacteria bacterium CG_4_10_14_0_8_um_filter_35_28]PJC32876.1 MAG: hypothetical protein CO048_04140 [Candidatus Roizmanbacteria bacterium CG_4_9_14_0_2_um_filter_35_15]
MKKLIIFFLLTALILPIFFVRADELEDITKELETLKKDLSSKEANYQELTTRLNQIKNQVSQLEIEIVEKENQVKKGEQALAYQKNLLNERSKSYYKNIQQSSLTLLSMLVADNLSDSFRKFSYQRSLVNEDKNTIIKVVLYIKNLEEIKASLTTEKNQLTYVKQEVDTQSKVLSSQISQTRSKIAQLSTRQQQLISERLAALGISRSAASLGRCDSDLTNGRDPGFSPRFAFFTYGVPNRVGMNQFGAYGRAKAGQNEEEILRAYYDNFELKKDYDKSININVNGYGSYNIEDYVKRIYEVPESWGADGMASLKAQAIASRSYALAYTNNGSGSICATEQCQVFHSDPKGGAWEQAVNDTAGWVMVQGGSPIKAWYSSTHGGYILKSSEIGWSDTSWTKHANDFDGSVGSFSDLSSKAYDRESPWFYCDWGSRSEYNKTAWLKTEELADMVNVVLLARADSSTQEHLYQVDKPHPYGGEVWNQDKVKQELKNRNISYFNRIDSGSVGADFSYGKTSSINFSGDSGSVSFDGAEFKNFFNLRAPANIQIVGPLYNIEKR